MIKLLFKLSETNINNINKLISILLVSLMIATPIIILIGVMGVYRKYQKWRGIEAKRKAEKIIVKMNNTSSEDDPEVISTEEELLNVAEEIKNPTPTKTEVDYSKMTIKELQSIAKERGIRGFSRMPKKTLLEKLV